MNKGWSEYQNWIQKCWKKIWRENGKYQGGDMQETVRGNSARAKVCFFFYRWHLVPTNNGPIREYVKEDG